MGKIFERITAFQDKHRDSVMKFIWMPLVISAVVFTMLLLIPGIFRAGFILVGVVLFLITILFHVLFVETMDDNQKKRSHLFIKLNSILMILYLSTLPMLTLARKAGVKAALGVGIMFSAVSALLVFIFWYLDTGKTLITRLDVGFVTGIMGQKECRPGDIVLCNIKEEVLAGAKDPREILPNRDRFLHMLILGPTGCGKTSQIILPMIEQDMKNFNSGITVLEPKGDLAIKAFMMAKEYGRDAIYFDPTYKNCAKFNPLAGHEVDVLENIATTFKMLNPDSAQFFLDLNEQLTRNAVKVLKRLDASEGMAWEGRHANLINLGRLLQNSGGAGIEMVQQFAKISAKTDSEAKENVDIASWFMNDYFPERSKVYENTSGVRSQVSKLVSNEYLREVMNPDIEKGEHSEIDFDKHLASGTVFCITTAQGALRDLSKYLGYFIILSLQSSVFRRPGNENTRRHHYLYIDEFQTYSTPGFADMLTQGRSYRVGSILATQARAQMAMGGGQDGKNFVELVSANARNIILFPGINKDDAKYYSEQFGEYEKVELVKGISRKQFNLLTGGLDRLGHPTETTREQKTMTANFTATDLIYSQDVGSGFGQITYSIIKNNSVQPAKVGKVTYIPRELNDLLDEKIVAYEQMYARKPAHSQSKDNEDTSDEVAMYGGGGDEDEFVPLDAANDIGANEEELVGEKVGMPLSLEKATIEKGKEDNLAIEDEVHTPLPLDATSTTPAFEDLFEEDDELT